MAELLSPLAEATLAGGMYVAFEAIDPTTGAAVTGVKVSQIALLAELQPGGTLVQGSLDDTEAQWQPIPIEAQ